MSAGSGQGGSRPAPRGSRTDPRPHRDSQRSRGAAYRSNLSDEQVNTTGLDDRPNNWDFSDWRPSDVFDSKRIKKENPEKERDKAQRERSLRQDSPPGDARRKHTPSTYPRTKVAPGTPAAERRSLERLRQQLQFSDQDEMSQASSERNNERPPSSSYERQLNFTDQLTQAAGEPRAKAPQNGASKGSGGTGGSLTGLGAMGYLVRQAQEGLRQQRGEEQNNNRQARGQAEMPDSNQLVSRLMQVRDYIKQAMQMMDRLRAAPVLDQEALTKTRKLGQVIEQLREQEQNYMDFLMKVLSSEEAALLSADEEAGGGETTEEGNDDTTSVDMDDAQSEVSEATTEASILGPVRPRIESHLGFYPYVDENRAPSCLSESDYEAIQELRRRQNQREAKESNQAGVQAEDEFLETRNRELELLTEDQRRIHDIIAGQAQAAMEEKQSELDQLRKQRDLLRNMLTQQRQLRDLQGRQVALLQQQRQSARDMTEAGNQEDGAETEPGVAAGGEDSQSVDSDTLARQLGDLKAQLDYAKNMYTNQPDKSVDSSRDDVPEADLSSVEQQKTQLLEKLQHLQGEKNRMDDLLKELKTMRDSKFMQLNNELDAAEPPSPASNSQSRARARVALDSADNTILDANEVLQLLDDQSKVQKLDDVRSRLSQLKDLVQYYESGTRFIHDDDGDEDETELPPAMPDLDTMREDLEAHREVLRDLKASGSLDPPQSIVRNQPQATVVRHQPQPVARNQAQAVARNQPQPVARNQAQPVARNQPQPVARNPSEDEGESEVNFALGPFENDPEIMAQVNKLKSAKQRLRRLKDMVENMPTVEDATAVLDEVNQLNAALGMVGGAPALEAPPPARQAPPPALRPEPQTDPELEEGSAEYQMKVEEQKAELRKLMEQRKKLQGAQEELRKLYENLPMPEDRAPLGAESGGGDVPAPPRSARNVTSANQQVTSANQQATSSRNKDSRKVVQRESVTFQEPEVASNEEVYNRMRSQRILREELRSRKRELEAIMRKGDLRKPYSRINQDNQSDNVSFSNKSDSYGFGNLSADVTTMATWGGSSEQNLEEMKNSNHSNSSHSNSTSTSDNEDDAYPSDGVVQVEEEEEEEESDANTYTVDDEDDLIAKTNIQPPIIDIKAAGHKVALPDTKNDLRSKPRYNAWASDTYPKMSSQKNKRQRAGQLRQENYRSPEDLVSERAEETQSLRQLKRKLETLCTTLNRDLSQMKTYEHALNSYLGNAGMNNAAAAYPPNPLSAASYSSMTTPPFPQATPSFAQAPPTFVPGTPSGSTVAPPDAMAAYTQQLILQQMQLGLQQCQQLIYQQQMEIRSLNSQFSAISGSHDELQVQNLPPHILTRVQPISPSPLIALAPGGPFPGDEEKRAPREKKEKRKKSPAKEVPKLKLEEMKRRAGNKRPESAVVGRKYPSGDRASATASLASKITPKAAQKPGPSGASRGPSGAPAGPRPGLSAMISGTSFLDELSQSSQVSSVKGDSALSSPVKRPRDDRESDCAVGLSLFEALRENIYSEVASLISQNEGRPHYLIELFRELQLLRSDYLRQRALYALKDLVSSTIDVADEPEDEEEDKATAPLWMTGNVHTSEQTPSESLITSDDDASPVKQCSGKSSSAASSSRRRQEVTAQVHQPRPASQGAREPVYDYQETVDNMSSLSTPPSSGAWDGPFAQDSLGDTVIHLDKAMARMREYERKLSEGLAATNDSSPLFRRTSSGTQTEEKASSSSAVDAGNESSESEAQPHIDTRQLDSKIKSIMTQVIPILKTHMEDTCSPDLLTYMKTVILALAHQRGEEHEHSQFFHKQLSRLIQDTLTKYEGRKMVECVEDLVVDISEILFSELAFYHLMRGLDENKVRVARERADRNASVTSSDLETLSETQQPPARRGQKRPIIEYEDTSDDELDDTLDKARDDELAEAVNVEQDSDQDPDRSDLAGVGAQFAAIHLAPSETKPFNRIGSDEDDEGSDDDDSISDKEGCDTAVSRDAEKEADSSKETLRAEDQEEQEEEQEEGTMEINGLAGSPVSPDDFEHVNGERGEEFITVEELPLKLDLNQEELLMKQAMDEAQQNSAVYAALTLTDEELAGDSSAAPEPTASD